MGGDRAGKVTAVMHDTTDLDAVVEFWSEFLGLKVEHRDGNYCYLSALSEGGPHLAFQRVAEEKTGKNRVHLDIQVPDRAAAAAWVVAKGGRVIEEHDHPGGHSWTVLADPQGNEFCVYEKPDDAA